MKLNEIAIVVPRGSIENLIGQSGKARIRDTLTTTVISPINRNRKLTLRIQLTRICVYLITKAVEDGDGQNKRESSKAGKNKIALVMFLNSKSCSLDTHIFRRLLGNSPRFSKTDRTEFHLLTWPTISHSIVPLHAALFYFFSSYSSIPL